MHPIKAEFVAKEVIKHHDKHGTHMPTKQIDFVKNVGDYVHKNYNDLKRFGFSHKEALVTYKEGSTMISKYDKSHAIKKADLKQIQTSSKRQLETQYTTNFTIKNQQNNFASSLEI